VNSERSAACDDTLLRYRQAQACTGPVFPALEES